LRIEKLTGSVARFGSSQGYPLYGVRLRATVCTGSDAEIYPDFTIAHYLLVGSPTRKWTLVRKVFARPPYLVPLQERWQGRRCGPARVDDPFPPTKQVESNNSAIHRAATASLSRSAPVRHMQTKRVAVQCGGIGGVATCSPARLLTPPWVVGQRRDAAVERLRDAGFRVGVYRAEKSKRGVPAGVIVDQEPARGMRMCRRADISIVVSI
jgi:hypothetical protein